MLSTWRTYKYCSLVCSCSCSRQHLALFVTLPQTRSTESLGSKESSFSSACSWPTQSPAAFLGATSQDLGFRRSEGLSSASLTFSSSLPCPCCPALDFCHQSPYRGPTKTVTSIAEGPRGPCALPKCVALAVGVVALGPNGQVCSLRPYLGNTYCVQVTTLLQWG